MAHRHEAAGERQAGGLMILGVSADGHRVMVQTYYQQMAAEEADLRAIDGDEARAFIEGEIWRYLKIDRGRFERLAASGELPDHPAVAHLLLMTGARTPGSC